MAASLYEPRYWEFRSEEVLALAAELKVDKSIVGRWVA